MPANRKNLLSGGLLLALMALTICLLLRGQQLSQILALLGQVRAGWVWCAVALTLSFVGCEAMGTKLVLTSLGHRTSYLRCLGYSFVGFYVSSITPGSTGGQPAQIYYMNKDGVPGAHATLDMLLLSACYQGVSLLYAIAALAAYPGLLSGMGTGLRLLLLYGGGAMLVLTVGLLSFMFRPSAARRLSEQAIRLLAHLRILKDREKAERRLDRQMEEYQAGAACIRRRPALVMGLMGLTFLQLTALYAVPYAVYRAFGLTGHGVFEIICAQALLTLAVDMLPLPGAVGAAEGGFVRFFSVFFGAELVTPAVLISRGVSFYAALAISAAITVLVHLLAQGRARRRVLQGA